MRFIKWLENKGLIEQGRKKSSVTLPEDTRRCKKCGNPGMRAVGAFLGGWSHRETVFDYQCPKCGHKVTIESHSSFHRGIVYFFLLLELVIFLSDDSPSYLIYSVFAAIFIALIILFRSDERKYPVTRHK